MKRPCPVRGCVAGASHPNLMCPRHWFQVPPFLRQRIWNLFRGGHAGSDLHRAACFQAVQLVNEKQPAQVAP